MKLRMLSALLMVSVLGSNALAQQPYEPAPLEYAPDGELRCSWSTMRQQEYQTCLKRKKFFEQMSPEEKKQHNEQVRLKRMEAELRRLDRLTR